MAEKEGGIVEGVMGSGEAEERVGEETGSRADDVATAVLMDAARFDSELSKKAGDYLDEQRALVKLQIQHFDEERRLAIEAAKRKRFFDHFRMSFQLFLTLAGAVIGLSAVIMVLDAISSKNVVVEAFDVPHSLADQGMTGKTVAAGLLDVLSNIQADTRSDAERRSLSNAWTNEISLEVPETGLTIGQIEKTLKSRFGHDQHIEGDVAFNEKGELTLTVRGTGIQAKSFINDTNDLEKLLKNAGEYVYSKSQPALWTSYLNNGGRFEEIIRFAKAEYQKAAPNEKPYLLNNWGNATAGMGGRGAMHEALAFYLEAVRQKPDFWPGFNNIMFVLNGTGDEEGVVKVGEQLIKLSGGRPGRVPEFMFQNYDQVINNWPALIAANIADLELHNGLGSTPLFYGPENLNIALEEIFNHDIERATIRVKTTQIDPNAAQDVAALAIDKALIAEEMGDFELAAKEWDAFAIAYADQAVATSNPAYICFAALSYEKAGLHDKADNALEAPMKAVGIATFTDCYRFKADLLELRGDWVGAKEWYGKAIKLGPSIPTVYYSYGAALINHGQLDEAIKQLQLANQKGPNWANPLKVWGDVLAKQGKKAEALEKYDEALKYAPNWKKLKEARELAVNVKS